MKHRLLVLISLLTFFLATNCVTPYPAPKSQGKHSRRNVDQETISQIIPEKTDLIEVLLKLGEPDTINENWVGYRNSYKTYGWFWSIYWLHGDCRVHIEDQYQIYFDNDWIVTEVKHNQTSECK